MELAIRFAKIENRLADLEKELRKLAEQSNAAKMTIAEFAVKVKEELQSIPSL